MNRPEVLEKLKAIVTPYVQNKEALASFGEETDFLEDLQINSAHLVDIILDAEEAFDIEIDDDAAEQMLTVKAAIEVVEAQMKA
ncbi:MAG: acyl carrier protein [Bacteroidota bacterium]